MKFDLTITGYIVLDYIVRGSRTIGPIPGGPCVYAGLSARAVGASVAPVGKLGSDFGVKRLSWLREKGLPVGHVIISDGPTTSFRIIYHRSGRTMQVPRICEPFTEQDLSVVPSTRALYVGGVLNELAPLLLLRLARRGMVIGVDAQSYTRTIRPDGRLRLKERWHDRSVLRNLTLFKMSENEAKPVIGGDITAYKLSKLGPEVVIVTKGPGGALVWSRREGPFKIDPYKTQVKDPTGAGDAFLSGFFISWLHTHDVAWSASVGASIASFVVSEFGPGNFGTRRQIELRAQRIHESIVRV